MSNWICTDPDCMQHSKKINDYTWYYIEIREGLEPSSHGVVKVPVVVSAVIDLQTYTLDDIWDACSGYYDSFEQIVQQYGFREAFHIMAECIFEQLPFDEMEFCAKQNNIEEAKAFIQEWMRSPDIERK